MSNIINANEFMEADGVTREFIKQNARKSMTRAECEYLSLLCDYGVDYYESTLQMLWLWKIDDETRH